MYNNHILWSFQKAVDLCEVWLRIFEYINIQWAVHKIFVLSTFLNI